MTSRSFLIVSIALVFFARGGPNEVALRHMAGDVPPSVVADCSLPALPGVPSGEILALTYNVAGLPEGVSKSQPSRFMPLIAPRLNGYDLVLVQESWLTPDPNPYWPLRVYHEILASGTDHPYKSEPAPLPLGQDRNRPSALVSDGLNQFSRLPFERIVRRRWEECFDSAADCYSLKGFSVTRTALAPDVAVDVYNVHMEAGNTPEDDRVRDRSITELADFIEDYSAGRALIVGGDFNLRTDREPGASQLTRLLAATGLTDVCSALGCPVPGSIDKFLFRSTENVTIAPVSWRFESDVFRTDRGEPLSDHRPLAVRFAWSAGPPADLEGCTVAALTAPAG